MPDHKGYNKQRLPFERAQSDEEYGIVATKSSCHRGGGFSDGELSLGKKKTVMSKQKQSRRSRTFSVKERPLPLKSLSAEFPEKNIFKHDDLDNCSSLDESDAENLPAGRKRQKKSPSYHLQKLFPEVCEKKEQAQIPEPKLSLVKQRFHQAKVQPVLTKTRFRTDLIQDSESKSQIAYSIITEVRPHALNQHVGSVWKFDDLDDFLDDFSLWLLMLNTAKGPEDRLRLIQPRFLDWMLSLLRQYTSPHVTHTEMRNLIRDYMNEVERMQKREYFHDIIVIDEYVHSVTDTLSSCIYSFSSNDFFPCEVLAKIGSGHQKAYINRSSTFSDRPFFLGVIGGVITSTTFHKGQSSLKFSQFLITAINNNGKFREFGKNEPFEQRFQRLNTVNLWSCGVWFFGSFQGVRLFGGFQMTLCVAKHTSCTYNLPSNMLEFGSQATCKVGCHNDESGAASQKLSAIHIFNSGGRCLGGIPGGLQLDFATEEISDISSPLELRGSIPVTPRDGIHSGIFNTPIYPKEPSYLCEPVLFEEGQTVFKRHNLQPRALKLKGNKEGLQGYYKIQLSPDRGFKNHSGVLRIRLRQQLGYSIRHELSVHLTVKVDGHVKFAKAIYESQVISDEPTDHAIYIKEVKAYFAEYAIPELKAPPPNENPTFFSTSDKNLRLVTFRRGSRRHRNFSDAEFSEAGFYLSDSDIIVCFSCQIQLNVYEVFSRGPADPQWHHPDCRHILALRTRLPGLQVESDTPGRVSDDIADPPGQQSVYIPPGDVRREAYRLSTFEQFPVTCSISRKSLAKSGFFFTGFYDRAKCFACARTVERWEETDNPAELKWHKPNCPFPRGEECGNVSLPSLFQSIASAVPSSAASSSVQARPNPSHQPGHQGEQILEQRDPNTGAIIRRVRYPNDLPERIRQTGGTFEIGPNNQVTIRSGPGPAPRNPAHVGLGATQHQPRRQWRMANVISADHKRFLTNLFLNRELDRLSSFARWPVGRPNIAPAYLAKSGFFYLGDMDRTQCFSCGGVLRNWNLEDDAEVEHRTHFPQCRMVVGSEPRNIPVHEHPETEEDKERKYPLRFPANPHMRSEAARLGTFDRRWPMGKTAATPAEISQAGFFFLGDRDRAKCWYCNGGLQNWEYDDIPWIEHAKWFPNCQFLLRIKGQHFVYRHLALNPHLARPIIARQDGSPLESVGGQPAATSTGQAQRPRSQDVPPSEPRVNQPRATPIIVDPREEMRRRKERVENIMKNSENVKVVLAMGFDAKIVAALLEDKIDSGNVTNPNDIYEGVSELLDDVAKKEEELKKEEEERRNQASALLPQPSLTGPSSMRTMSSMYSGVSGVSGMSSLGPAPGSGKYNVSYFGDDDDEDERMDQDMYGSMEGTSASLNNVTATKHLQGAEENSASLQEALTKIEEERMCKICFTNQADMVFVPCAHMCCCMECTQAITQCPVCRKKIEKAIKTYIN